MIHLLKKSILFRDEKPNSSKIQRSPSDSCTESCSSDNASSNASLNADSEVFSMQHEELQELLEELQTPVKGAISENDRLERYFCLDTVFHLSNRVLFDFERLI